MTAYNYIAGCRAVVQQVSWVFSLCCAVVSRVPIFWQFAICNWQLTGTSQVQSSEFLGDVYWIKILHFLAVLSRFWALSIVIFCFVFFSVLLYLSLSVLVHS